MYPPRVFRTYAPFPYFGAYAPDGYDPQIGERQQQPKDPGLPPGPVELAETA
jgi:hypothetical protein